MTMLSGVGRGSGPLSFPPAPHVATVVLGRHPGVLGCFPHYGAGGLTLEPTGPFQSLSLWLVGLGQSCLLESLGASMTLIGSDQSAPVSAAGMNSVQHKPETNSNPVPNHAQEGGRWTWSPLCLSIESSRAECKTKGVVAARQVIAADLLTALPPKLQRRLKAPGGLQEAPSLPQGF